MSSLNLRRGTVALSGHCWRNIAIALIDTDFGEGKAQACDNAPDNSSYGKPAPFRHKMLCHE